MVMYKLFLLNQSIEKDSVIVRFDHKDVLVLDRKKDPNLVFTDDEVDPKW